MILTALLLFAVQPQAAAAEPVRPTARDIYVGCSLLLVNVALDDRRPVGERGYARWFDASTCYLIAARALSEQSGNSAGRGQGNDHPSFCPPDWLNLSVHNVRPMAVAYLAYFERRAAAIADRPAYRVFVTAMRERWPCPSRRRRR